MGVALLLTANGLLGILLPLRALPLGFTAFDIGLMGTAYFSGFFVGCLLGPRLIRRVGHIRTFAALVSIVCALTLLHGLVDEKFVWWLARGLTGICFATIYVVIESWLNDRSTNENRGMIFSVYTVICLTVITTGQLAVMIASPMDFTLLAIAAILISLAAVPIVVSVATAPTPPATVTIRIRYLFERSHVAVVACFGVGMTNGAFWTLAPVFAQRDTPGTEAAAIFMSAAVIAGAAGQLPLGFLSDRMDRRLVIIGASMGASIGATALAYLGAPGSSLMYAAGVCFGAFALPLYALCVAHLNDFIEPGDYVEAASGLLMIYAAGAVIGPLVVAIFVKAYGVSSMFACTAVIHASIAIYTFVRLGHKQSVSESDRSNFSDALVMASMAAEIDPRPNAVED